MVFTHKTKCYKREQLTGEIERSKKGEHPEQIKHRSEEQTFIGGKWSSSPAIAGEKKGSEQQKAIEKRGRERMLQKKR